MKFDGQAAKDLSAIAFSENITEVKDVFISALERLGYDNFACFQFRRGVERTDAELFQAIGSFRSVAKTHMQENLCSSSPASASFDRDQIVDFTPLFQDPSPRPNAENIPRIIELLQDHGIHNVAVIPLIRSDITTRSFIALADPAPENKAPFLHRLSQRQSTLAPLVREFSARMMMKTTLKQDQVLTSSEILVLEQLARGQRAATIAKSTGKSIETIRNQIVSARRRLQAKTTLQAISISVRLGLVKI